MSDPQCLQGSISAPGCAAERLKAEIAELGRDAARYRAQFATGVWDYHTAWIGESKERVDALIDAQ